MSNEASKSLKDVQNIRRDEVPGTGNGPAKIVHWDFRSAKKRLKCCFSGNREEDSASNVQIGFDSAVGEGNGME